jgi:chromate transporter
VKALLELFLVFAKIGSITFGGGYAMLPILERELVQKRAWTTSAAILEYYTIAQVTPGIIAVNVATIIGYNRCGVPGGIIATLGFALPSLTMIVIIAQTLRNFADMPVVQHCFNGIRLAVGALILDTVCKLVKNLRNKELPLLKNIIILIIFMASFALSLMFNANPVIIVLSAGLCGFVFLGNRVPTPFSK